MSKRTSKLQHARKPRAYARGSDVPIPARELRRLKMVLVVGGTFDPVHRMHVEGPREIARRLYGREAWVLFVPAARSPFKDRGPVAGDEDRVAMLRLALEGVERASVWEEEIERARGVAQSDGARSGKKGQPDPKEFGRHEHPYRVQGKIARSSGGARSPTRSLPPATDDQPFGLKHSAQADAGESTPRDLTGMRAIKPSYTIDTVRELKKLLPARVGVRLVIGADQAAGFYKWKSARALFRAARPLVMLREPLDEPGKLLAALESARFWTRAELRMWAESVAPTDVVRVAATGVRGAVGSGERAVGEVDDRVMGYIRERGLYRT